MGVDSCLEDQRVLAANMQWSVLLILAVYESTLQLERIQRELNDFENWLALSFTQSPVVLPASRISMADKQQQKERAEGENEQKVGHHDRYL